MTRASMGYSWKWVEGIATQTKNTKIIYSNNRLSIYEWRESKGTRTTLNWLEIFFFYVMTVEDVSTIFVKGHTEEEVGAMIGLPCHSHFVGPPFSRLFREIGPVYRAVGFNKWLSCLWMNTYAFSGVAALIRSLFSPQSPPLRNWCRARKKICDYFPCTIELKYRKIWRETATKQSLSSESLDPLGFLDLHRGGGGITFSHITYEHFFFRDPRLHFFSFFAELSNPLFCIPS